MHERKIHPKFLAIAKNGRLFVNDPAGFSHYLLNLENKNLEVVVKKQTKERSRQEEKYFHAVVVRMIADEMSIEDDEARNLLKSLFLTVEESKQVNTPTGYKTLRYERILSTTELSDEAYREFWNKCVKWAALPTDPKGLSQTSGLSLFVPMPGEVDFKNW